MWKNKLVHGFVLAALAGCATAPVGPRVAVMPTPGKPFELFAQEDQICRNYATQSTNLPSNDAAAQNVASNAAVGAVIGAAIGALAGGNSRGAGVGAAAGLLAGSAAGSSKGAYAARDSQRLYDIAYQQCMYSKGNQVPGYSYQRLPSAPRTEAAPYPPPPPPQGPALGR